MTLQFHAPTGREVHEGRAKVILPQTGAGTVFYNPRMSLNRDLAVLFTSMHFPAWRKLRVCDPMTGSGVRAVRYVLECSNVATLLAGDRDPGAIETAQRTIRLNDVETKVSLVTSDASLLLTSKVNERFDLIDLDPFGSPGPFFESALRATADGGVLACTATDMGPLSGARPEACFRKYGVRPARTEFEKEMAVRILASCLAMVAGRLELGIRIVFAHASDHYVRIYASISKGKTAANETAGSLGLLEYCRNCLMRHSTSSLESIHTICENCGSKTEIAGYIWLGSLWDVVTVQAMMQNAPTLSSSRLTEVQNILSRIDEERDAPAFHYETDSIAQRFRIKPPAIRKVLAVLHENGYRATRTHFNPNGFRTNASIAEVASLLRD